MSRAGQACILRCLISLLPMIVGGALPLSAATVDWTPVIPDQVFPAAIISLGSIKAKPGTSSVLCDPRGSFRVRVKSASANTRVHVEVLVDGFFLATSSCDAVLKNANQQYLVAPTPRWDMHKLTYNDQPYPATVVLRVKANGKDLGQKTVRFQIRAVNDVPYSAADSKGNFHDQSLLYAAFVNENSPVIDKLLHEALEWHAVNKFYGYRQGKASKEDVEMQVFALWNALQHRHVKYSSITRPSGSSQKVHSQTVRFISQSVEMSQANCVDGSVLFASVLYKIGLSPVLMRLPGHMFIAYHTDRKGKRSDLEFLETTMIGNGERPDSQPFADRKAAQNSKSYQQFLAASKRGMEEYSNDFMPNWRNHKREYYFITIERMRNKGINPIPR